MILYYVFFFISSVLGILLIKEYLKRKKITQNIDYYPIFYSVASLAFLTIITIVLWYNLPESFSTPLLYFFILVISTINFYWIPIYQRVKMLYMGPLIINGGIGYVLYDLYFGGATLIMVGFIPFLLILSIAISSLPLLWFIYICIKTSTVANVTMFVLILASTATYVCLLLNDLAVIIQGLGFLIGNILLAKRFNKKEIEPSTWIGKTN